jgi:5'-3' exonuclease
MAIAIIDGDVVVHRACYNRTAGLITDCEITGSKLPPRQLDENGEPIFTEEEDRLYLETCYTNLKRMLDKIQERLWCDTRVVYIKGIGNFRDDLFPGYKGHRKSKTPNKFLPMLRQLLELEGLAIPAHGREADDLIRIKAEECRAAGEEFVICSIDKDLKCIPGKHYYIHKDEEETITEEYAMRFYYEQLLQGDPVDAIQGIPKIGPKTAQKLLVGCESEEEFQFVVQEQYQKYFGDGWIEALEFNGMLIHIQKTLDDVFSIDDWV